MKPNSLTEATAHVDTTMKQVSFSKLGSPLCEPPSKCNGSQEFFGAPPIPHKGFGSPLVAPSSKLTFLFHIPNYQSLRPFLVIYWPTFSALRRWYWL